MKSIQIFKIHLFLLGLVIINSITKAFFEIGLVLWIDNFFKILVVITGVWVFWSSKKSKRFKIANFYFLLYPITIAIGLIGVLFRGVFGAIILSIVLSPFNLNQTRYNEEGIRIYDNPQGFLGSCCNYIVTENKLYFFEKEIKSFDNQEVIDFENIEINELSKSVELIFLQKNFDRKSNSFKTKEKKIRIEK